MRRATVFRRETTPPRPFLPRPALGPVRWFDGVDDVVNLGVGSLGSLGGGAFTLAAVVRIIDYNTFGTWFYLGAGATPRLAVEAGPTSGGRFVLHIDGTFQQLFVSPPTDGWIICAVTKAAGSVTARGHKYVFSTSTWSHANAGAAQGNAANAGTALQIGAWSTDTMTGYLAAVAAWSRELTDAEVEQLDTGLQAWSDLNPAGFWPLTQYAISDGVQDLVGASDETGRTGTVAIGYDQPTPFDLTVAGAAAKTAADTVTVAEVVASRGVAAADTATVSDAVAARQVTDSDTFTVTDAVNQLAQAKTDTDQVTVTEVVAARGIADTETATVSEQVSSRALTAGDTATISEAVSARALTASDTGTVTEAVSARALTAGDQATIDDAVAARALTASDTFTVTDAVAAIDTGADKTGADTVTVAEEIAARTLTAADTIGVTDAVSVLQQFKTDADTIGVTDALSARVVTDVDVITAAEEIIARAVTAGDTAIVVDAESLDTHEVIIPGALTVAGSGPGLAVVGATVSTLEVSSP